MIIMSLIISPGNVHYVLPKGERRVCHQKWMYVSSLTICHQVDFDTVKQAFLDLLSQISAAPRLGVAYSPRTPGIYA
jgi:hypothetical protein